MKTNGEKASLLHKLATGSSILIALAVIVLATLQICNVWPAAACLYTPLMGVNLLLQAYTQWKTNRGVAIFSLCAAGIVFLCSAVILIPRVCSWG